MQKFWIFLCILSFSFKVYCEEDHLPTVAVVLTGGTFAQQYIPGKGVVPTSDPKKMIEAVPNLSKIANIMLVNFSNIDSVDMTPQNWQALSRVVDQVAQNPKICGIVVVHGTDTMEDGAYFLDLTLRTNKPVIFTGAMRPSNDPFADGPFNLYNSVMQACAEDAQNWGVTINMNTYIQSARNVRKTNTTNIQSFESGEKGYLGFIFNDKVHRLNDRLYRQYFPLPEKLPNIIIYRDFSGDSGEMLKQAVDSKKVDGIVIEALGSGNVNKDVFKVILEALNKKIPVVISSDVYYGGVFPIYGSPGGGKSLHEAGAIINGNLTATKARFLLMMALAKHGKDTEKIQKYFDIP